MVWLDSLLWKMRCSFVLNFCSTLSTSWFLLHLLFSLADLQPSPHPCTLPLSLFRFSPISSWIQLLLLIFAYFIVKCFCLRRALDSLWICLRMLPYSQTSECLYIIILSHLFSLLGLVLMTLYIVDELILSEVNLNKYSLSTVISCISHALWFIII